MHVDWNRNPLRYNEEWLETSRSRRRRGPIKRRSLRVYRHISLSATRWCGKFPKSPASSISGVLSKVENIRIHDKEKRRWECQKLQTRW
jgi:hypothetical protein